MRDDELFFLERGRQFDKTIDDGVQRDRDANRIGSGHGQIQEVPGPIDDHGIQAATQVDGRL